jgi:hypothetical protein
MRLPNVSSYRSSRAAVTRPRKPIVPRVSTDGGTRSKASCRIKDFRRITKRFDKLARNTLAATMLVGALCRIKL